MMLGTSSVTVSNSRFANAADGTKFGSAGNGYLFNLTTNDCFDFSTGNVIRGTLDAIFKPSLDFATINKITCAPINRSTKDKTNVSSPPQYTLGADGVLTVGGFKFALAKAYQSDLSVKITTLDSYLMPGENLTLRAWGGPITLATGGNIKLPGVSELTIPTDGCVTLSRQFKYSTIEFEVISVSIPKVGSAPTSGGYYARKFTTSDHPSVS